MTTLKRIFEENGVYVTTWATKAVREWLQQQREDDTQDPYKHRADTFDELLEELKNE